MKRDVDHTSPSSVEVKNEWSCTSTPAYALIACTGINLGIGRSLVPLSSGLKSSFTHRYLPGDNILQNLLCFCGICCFSHNGPEKTTCLASERNPYFPLNLI